MRAETQPNSGTWRQSGATDAPADLELRDVTKSFGAAPVVNRLSLAVGRGEFVTILGPSGCGKTTTLRIVAGFVSPDVGDVFIRGTDVTALPPDRRGIGLVFQHYCLFPHMTVAANVGYGLRLRGLRGDALTQRVREALDLVRLDGLDARYPHQLSGGQQQRVALARAIVIRPAVLLLDEPLSNLDTKLRQTMRDELRQLQRDVGVTTVLVTHDQEEALALSDRVVVMNHGRAEQVGPPDAVYRRPRSPFVAEFLGAKNMWDGVVTMRDGPVALIRTADFEIAAAVPEVREPAAVVVIVRPEAISIAPDDRAAARTGRNRVAGEVRSVQYLGAWIEYIVQVGSTHIRVIAQNREGSSGAPDPSLDGGRVILEWSAAACHVIPPA